MVVVAPPPTPRRDFPHGPAGISRRPLSRGRRRPSTHSARPRHGPVTATSSRSHTPTHLFTAPPPPRPNKQSIASAWQRCGKGHAHGQGFIALDMDRWHVALECRARRYFGRGTKLAEPTHPQQASTVDVVCRERKYIPARWRDWRASLDGTRAAIASVTFPLDVLCRGRQYLVRRRGCNEALDMDVRGTRTHTHTNVRTREHAQFRVCRSSPTPSISTVGQVECERSSTYRHAHGDIPTDARAHAGTHATTGS